MEELRIKCPSCGIVLQVKNSKNEAVKRITCPNCKKQLAVTFHDEPKPAQYVEIKMVQLADGSQKTIVRALTDDHVVCVNGERLLKDDEVVLAPGDKLEIDGKPQFTPTSETETKQTAKPVSEAPTPVKQKPATTKPTVPEPKRNNWYLSIALIAVIVAAFVLWQMSSETNPVDLPKNPSADTIVVPQHSDKKNEEHKIKKEVKKDDSQTDVQPQETKASLADMSEYDLEKLAMKGNVEALCQLGKRWVNRGDSINVVKGIKYLKQASYNGSSEATTALRKVYATLQQSAANGSTTASNILREQR